MRLSTPLSGLFLLFSVAVMSKDTKKKARCNNALIVSYVIGGISVVSAGSMCDICVRSSAADWRRVKGRRTTTKSLQTPFEPK